MVLRDRRILLSSIVLPLLVTPLIFLGTHWSIQKRARSLRQMVYHYAVAGPDRALARSVLSAARELRSHPESVVPASPPAKPHRHRRSNQEQPAQFRFEELDRAEPLEALNRGEVQLVLEATPGIGLPGSAAGNAPGLKSRDDPESEPARVGAPNLRLFYRADRDESTAALSEMQDALDQVRQAHRVALLHRGGFTYEPARMAVVHESDLASKTQVAGLALGKSLTLILLVFVLTSGAVVATDSIAGEKERGTLETILTSSVNRVDILAAKSLVILTIALIITLIQAGNLLVYIGLKLLPVPPNLAAAISPGVGLLLVIMFLPVMALAASGLLLISGYARSYREAQMYFMPVLLVGVLPGLAPFLPGLPLRSVVALVPVANIALATREILIGRFDWPMIGVSWIVTALAAAWTTRFGVRFLSAERLVTAAENDQVSFQGGPALFERQVWRWFAGLWAGLIIISNYLEKADLRAQVLINLAGLLFGGSCLMMWRYHLDPRQALALRLPRPWVWLGVLFAVPGGLLTSLGLFRLANLVLPVSSKMTEGFNQSVLPPGLSSFQLLIFLAVLPGIFEEIAFRGLLLHGLRRSLHPAALALVVGIAFGIFHIALFRFVPTACLGMMLAAVTLLSGSILPAMMWHGLNNAMGILMYKQQIPETELPLGCYIAGVGILAGAFWIFWRNRTPYPDLRRPTSKH